jgi:hypothetical protein
MESIRVRLAPGVYGRIFTIDLECEPKGGIKAWDNAAFGVQPQGFGVANRVAESPMAADSASLVSLSCLKTLSVWQYRDRPPGAQPQPHAIVVTSPHN